MSYFINYLLENNVCRTSLATSVNYISYVLYILPFVWLRSPGDDECLARRVHRVVYDHLTPVLGHQEVLQITTLKQTQNNTHPDGPRLGLRKGAFPRVAAFADFRLVRLPIVTKISGDTNHESGQ